MRRFAFIIPLFLIVSILFSSMPSVRASDTWHMNTASAGVDPTFLKQKTFDTAYNHHLLYHNNQYYLAYAGLGTTAYVWVYDSDFSYLGRYDINLQQPIADICVFKNGANVYAAVGTYVPNNPSSANVSVTVVQLHNGTAPQVRTVAVTPNLSSATLYARVYPLYNESGDCVYVLAAGFSASTTYGYLLDANNNFNSFSFYSGAYGQGLNGHLWGYLTSNYILYWTDGRNFFKYPIGGSNTRVADRGSYPNGQIFAYMVYYGGETNYIFRFFIQNDASLSVWQIRMFDNTLSFVNTTLRNDVRNIIRYQYNSPQSVYLDTIIVQTTEYAMMSVAVSWNALYSFGNVSSAFIMDMRASPLYIYYPLWAAYANGKLFYLGLCSGLGQFFIGQTDSLAPPTPPSGGSGIIESINATSNRKILFYRELDNTYNIKYVTVQTSANTSGTLYAYTGSSGANMALFGSKAFSAGNQTLTVHGDSNGKMVAVLFKFNDDYQLNYSCATYSSSVMYYDNDIESYLSINLNNFADLTNVGNPLVGVNVFIPPTDNRTGFIGDPRGGGGAGGQYFNYTLWFIVNNMSQPNQLDINRNNTIPAVLQNVKTVVEDYGLPWGLFGLIVFAGCCFATAFSLSKHNAADPRLILFFVTVIGYVLFAAGVVDFIVPALCTIAVVGISAMAVAKQFGGGGGGE